VKAALIVQRFGRGFVGGSEALAFQYATILAEHLDVEVLTTCARDYTTWKNEYPVGLTTENGIRVRRFANDFPRTLYWGRLYNQLKGPIDDIAFADSAAEKIELGKRLARWPRSLQEEVIYWQGPYPSGLFEYLRAQRKSYDMFLFFTYLYATSYFGMQQVPAGKTIFCPTLHDEPLAYLPIMRYPFQRARSTIFLSHSERRLAEQLYQVKNKGRVVGMAIPASDATGALPKAAPKQFVLYAGRIEVSKGTDVLMEYFRAYKQRFPSDLKLVMIGTAGARLPQDSNICYLGFVSDAEKRALMRHAHAFLHPSPYESFSIVLLESFAEGTPALVNGASGVLAEHCAQSGAGESYRSADEFCTALHRLLSDSALRRDMGERGRNYVAANFSKSRIAEQLQEVIEDSLTPRGQRVRPLQTSSTLG
jgi:glycosyltransferase involved in cell wall biosynthesis